MESGYEAREEEKKSRAMHRQGGEEEGKDAGSEAANAADEKREREAQRRKVADQVLDLDLMKSDPQKLYPIMYYVLKVGSTTPQVDIKPGWVGTDGTGRAEGMGRMDGGKAR